MASVTSRDGGLAGPESGEALDLPAGLLRPGSPTGEHVDVRRLGDGHSIGANAVDADDKILAWGVLQTQILLGRTRDACARCLEPATRAPGASGGDRLGDRNGLASEFGGARRGDGAPRGLRRRRRELHHGARAARRGAGPPGPRLHRSDPRRRIAAAFEAAAFLRGPRAQDVAAALRLPRNLSRDELVTTLARIGPVLIGVRIPETGGPLPEWLTSALLTDAVTVVAASMRHLELRVSASSRWARWRLRMPPRCFGRPRGGFARFLRRTTPWCPSSSSDSGVSQGPSRSARIVSTPSRWSS